MTNKRKVYGTSVSTTRKWRVIRGMLLRVGDRPSVKPMTSLANMFCGNVCTRNVVKHLRKSWEGIQEIS